MAIKITDIDGKRSIVPEVGEVGKKISDLKRQISLLPKFDIKVVSTLPTSDISKTTIYLLNVQGDSPDIYEEYLHIDGKWELLGSQKVDLSDYALKSEVPPITTTDSTLRFPKDIEIDIEGSTDILPTIYRFQEDQYEFYALIPDDVISKYSDGSGMYFKIPGLSGYDVQYQDDIAFIPFGGSISVLLDSEYGYTATISFLNNRLVLLDSYTVATFSNSEVQVVRKVLPTRTVLKSVGTDVQLRLPQKSGALVTQEWVRENVGTSSYYYSPQPISTNNSYSHRAWMLPPARKIELVAVMYLYEPMNNTPNLRIDYYNRVVIDTDEGIRYSEVSIDFKQGLGDGSGEEITKASVPLSFTTSYVDNFNSFGDETHRQFIENCSLLLRITE